MNLHAQNNETSFFYVLCPDKTWVFDQSERAQGPIYIIKCFDVPSIITYRGYTDVENKAMNQSKLRAKTQPSQSAGEKRGKTCLHHKLWLACVPHVIGLRSRLCLAYYD